MVGKILAEIEQLKQRGEARIKLVVAEDIAHSLVNWLKSVKGTKQVEIAGSYRRRKETVGDLDILATCERSGQVKDCSRHGSLA